MKVNHLLSRNIVYMKNIYALFTLIIITSYVYFPALNNDFTNWDDIDYVVENNDIKDLSLRGLQKIFTTTVLGHYHPVTMLSYCIDYKIFGLEARGFHLSSIIYHLIAVIGLFFLLIHLSQNFWMAFFTSLLFAIHPMHVETICWISDRKGLLAGLFIIYAMLFYIKYINTDKKYYFFLVLIFYILSLLSKSLFVAFPIVLILIDYIIIKKFNWSTLLNKQLFFLCSFFFGGLAIYTQKHVGATQLIQDYDFFDRVLIASNNFIIYLYKALLPVRLSAFYPYPSQGEVLGKYYYLSLLLCLGIIVFVFYFRKNKWILFASSFFILFISLMLQFIPVGKAMLAERYTYIPYIGIFMLLTIPFVILKRKYLLILCFSIVSLIYTHVTRGQIGNWKNSFTLWTSVVKLYPKSDIPNLNLGMVYLNRNKITKAIQLFSSAIDYNPNYDKAYYNRANAKLKLNDFKGALADYTQAITITPNFDKALNNRCQLYTVFKEISKALADCNKAIMINPTYSKAYYNRANVWYSESKYDKAIVDFTKAIQYDIDENSFLLRGNSYYQMKKYKNAISDYNQAIKLNVNFASAYHNKGLVYIALRNNIEAVNSLEKAIKYHNKLGNFEAAKDSKQLLLSIK